MSENVMHHIWAGLQELTHSGPKLRCGGRTHVKKKEILTGSRRDIIMEIHSGEKSFFPQSATGH